MPLTLNGTTGIAGVDGSAGTPAAQGSDTNTGVFYGADTVSISTGGTARVVVNSDGQTVLGAGTASLPAMSTTGDLNTGTFYPAADTIGWTTGGSERARIDSSGNLLVGTTSSPTGAKVRVTATPTSAWALDFSECSVVIANGGNAQLPSGAGMVVLTNTTTGDTGIYICGGLNVNLVSGTGSVYVTPTTSPASGKVCVARDGDYYKIFNNYGSSLTILTALIRTRAAI